MKEKLENNLDKDIERCKELIKTEHSNWIGMSNQDAISNVLADRETWKKIAEKIALLFNYYDEDKNCQIQITNFQKEKCNELNLNTCNQCIIDWARNEVENENRN